MKKIIVIILISLALVIGIFYWQSKNNTTSSVNKDTYQSGATKESIKDISGYEYTEKYTHPTKHFSFNYPKGFTVTSIPSDGGETILVQNANTKVGVQIVISPFQGADIDLTPDILKDEIPDMKIVNAQEVTVAPGRKGLAFESDNPAFHGRSSEIWFVFKGSLYQISTYYEFADFLKGIFTTFKFE